MLKCSLCGVTIKGFGNNPWPLAKTEQDKCCDDCNITEVIPARIQMLYDDNG